MSTRAYQTSRLRIAANWAIAALYDRTTSVLIARRVFSSKPLSRPATAKLATSRLTSHSNGPGSVSSKSLRLKTSLRSGAAKPPKLERWASPQSWVCKPVREPVGEVGRHQVGRTAVERERRDEHAAVADRHELRHAALRLLLEQLDRVGPVRRRLPVACDERGTSARAAFPRATRSATVKCSTRGGDAILKSSSFEGIRQLPIDGLATLHAERIGLRPAVTRPEPRGRRGSRDSRWPPRRETETRPA